MTRALPSQPSPQFLIYDMISGNTQLDPSSAPFSPIDHTPSQCTRSKVITIVPTKTKRRFKPTYAKMIEEAVFEKSQKKKGASLMAIKKYLQQKYGVDVKRTQNAKRIRKCIREATSNGGNLKQRTGTGASGSFVLLNDVRKKLQIKKDRLLSRSLKNTPPPSLVKKNTVPIKTSEMKKQEPSVTRMKVM